LPIAISCYIRYHLTASRLLHAGKPVYMTGRTIRGGAAGSWRGILRDMSTERGAPWFVMK